MNTNESVLPQIRTQTLVWIGTALALFLVLALLGLSMRLNQGGASWATPDLFYAIMTLHGLGMTGAMFMGGLAFVWFLLSRYVDPHPGLMWSSYVLIVLGAVGLVIGTLVGRFGPGWYLLYPLPFVNPLWPAWATGDSVISLILLGTGWLLAQLTLLSSLARRYGAGNLLGWQYFWADHPKVEIPPIVLITVVSLLAGSITTVFGAVLFLLYLAKWFNDALQFDALLLKNVVFLFGHTIVNITMYLGVAAIYELLPKFTGRPWKMNRVVAIAWSFVLLFILGAYFHHLYMDYAQPVSLQYLGQVLSYGSAVPATVVTVFGVGAQVYRSGVRWTFVPLSFFLGITGWVIGGFAAVVDSTIALNTVLHNTLWVPAHFHTYFLLGYLLILLGMTFYITGSERESRAMTALTTMVVGGSGFLLMFYLGGVDGVPRRFADYQGIDAQALSATAQSLAQIAAGFIVLFLLGFLLYLAALGRKRTATV
ncbi:MAG: cbb3-type cytochrome c oxidase subunit I [Gammaproteobacteria bacterium]